MDTRNKAIRFFMGSSSKDVVDSAASFYQAILRNLIRGVLTESQIGYLIRAMDQARAVQRFDVVDVLARTMIEARVSTSLQCVGLYFKANAQINRGQLVEAHSLLHRVAASALAPFSSRAHISIGAVAALSGEPGLQRKSYLRALQSSDPFTLLHANKMMAVLDANDGNHRGSLERLEAMFSFATFHSQYQPQSYYDYLNSLAFEMAEGGRLVEADNVSRRVLASPFSQAYPEWHETRAEIVARGRQASRSLVAVNRMQQAGGSTDNVLHFPSCAPPQLGGHPSTAIIRGELIRLEQAMVNKKKEGTAAGGFASLSEHEKRLVLAARLLKEAPGADLAAIFSAIPPAEQSRILLDAALSHASEETLAKLYEKLLERRKEENK